MADSLHHQIKRTSAISKQAVTKQHIISTLMSLSAVTDYGLTSLSTHCKSFPRWFSQPVTWLVQ